MPKNARIDPGSKTFDVLLKVLQNTFPTQKIRSKICQAVPELLAKSVTDFPKKCRKSPPRSALAFLFRPAAVKLSLKMFKAIPQKDYARFVTVLDSLLLYQHICTHRGFQARAYVTSRCGMAPRQRNVAVTLRNLSKRNVTPLKFRYELRYEIFRSDPRSCWSDKKPSYTRWCRALASTNTTP